ncbi:MAG TPA: phosphoglycerate dehydrogenase [Roseiflexaceae bacterium]|nr:phosphoglycerate dehydrogenase [Roseiflexaceae bacterium]HMP39222.1 phosphoglycerate dehydrogenase [Roseiflexaceae bacterium]
MDRILVTEQIAEEGIARLQAAAHVDIDTKLDRAGLLAALPEYDALVVRSATRVNDEVLAAGTRLRVVGRAGTGVDNIELDAATRRGILVVNAPASNSVAVAELTIALILSLARCIPHAHASLQGGRWERSSFMGFEVRGKTLGLVGLGRIGAEVARRARGMEMSVVAYDPIVSTERAAQLGVSLLSLDEVLAAADFISLHVPLVEATRNMMNTARLALMKPSAYLINAARGGIIDEPALYQALERGTIAGAALDTFAAEPPTGNPLIGHPRVITTPHLGASTREAQALTGVDVAEGVLTALAGGSPHYAVNAPFISPEQEGVISPYMLLARKIGALCTGLVNEPVRVYEIEYRGEIAGVDTAPIRLAVLQGLLAGTREERVTAVNAPLLARERGLKYREYTSDDAEAYAGMLVVRAQTADGAHEFVGTIIHGVPHIVEADGYWVTFEPAGPMLFTYHRDRPGLIGRVGTLLGEADVNIASMDVGRLAPREQAMMVLRLDDPVPEAVLARLRAAPDLDRAISIIL